MKNAFPLVIMVLVVAALSLFINLNPTQKPVPIVVTNFEECVSTGNPVMESYPRQCSYNGQTFTENVGNAPAKADLIRLTYPRPNQVIQSPLIVTGEARGNWFFEASFPVYLTDWDGKIIATGIAQARGEWMTTNFVPFEAKLTFDLDKNLYSNRGTLILRKDNASGLPEHDDALEIPVLFNIPSPKPTPKPTPTPVPPYEPVACTMDAKMCPDGSYVGRTGPKCEFSACPSTPTKVGTIASINERILNNGVYITPLVVVSDSRCPANVNCVWAGEVAVKVKLEKNGVTNEVEFKEGTSVNFQGSTVSLNIVLPQKTTAQIQQKDYRLTFKVVSSGN